MNKLGFNKTKNLKAISGMPQMSETLTGWQVPLILGRVTQEIIEGDKEEKITWFNFLGVWQPLKDEELQFKPEGLRSWGWIWIHAVSGSLNLETGDKVIFNQKRYKIMAVKDYSLNGFIEYQLVRDYEDLTNANRN